MCTRSSPHRHSLDQINRSKQQKHERSIKDAGRQKKNNRADPEIDRTYPCGAATIECQPTAGRWKALPVQDRGRSCTLYGLVWPSKAV